MLFGLMVRAMTSNIPDDDFDAGYFVGWQLVYGTLAPKPLTTIAPLTPLGSTPFLEGIKAGIEAAGAEIVPQS